MDITNNRVTMNSDYWPLENMKLDFSKGDYANFNASFAEQKHHLLDFTIKTYCLFVITR